MTSALRGDDTSVEVQNISPHGVWILVGEREYFMPHEQFPWFKSATVEQICAVELQGAQHLHWPQLDVDLTLQQIEDPERFPLVAS